jgi:hypothetical protein
MSGLKINFQKSEVMMILDDVKAQIFSSLFNCQQGSWPIKYLGTPVCTRRPTVAEMSFLVEKTKKKMGGRMGNAMSIGVRVVKIVAIYQMSMRLLHKSNIEQMDKPIRSFFGLGVLIKGNITLSNGSGFVNPRKRWFVN